MHYSLACHPGQNQGRVKIILKNGQKHDLPVGSLTELAALAAVLRERPVFLSDDGSYIFTGWEEPENYV